VPGDGTIPVGDWGHVYDKVLEAGKLVFLCDNSPLCGWEAQAEGVRKRNGSLKRVCFPARGFDVKNRDEGLRLLDKYGVEE